MELKGRWNGVYRYDSPGFPEEVPFELNVENDEGDIFSGPVQDDASRGGHPELGFVRGKVLGMDRIKFEKEMPSHFGRYLDGTTQLYGGSYRIFYKGQIDVSGSFSGGWLIRATLVRVYGRLYLMRGHRGTWTMTRSVP